MGQIHLKVWWTIKNYVGALKNAIPNWLNDAGVPKQSLFSVGSFVEYENIVNKTYEVREFVENDKRFVYNDKNII